MLLFRSEEHVRGWAATRGAPVGATFAPEQGWQLARAWFADRLSADWRRRTSDEAEAVFDSIGLTGPFWRLHEVSSPGGTDTSEA